MMMVVMVTMIVVSILITSVTAYFRLDAVLAVIGKVKVQFNQLA